MQNQAIGIIDSVDLIFIGEVARNLTNGGCYTVDADDAIAQVGCPTTTNSDTSPKIAFAQQCHVIE